MTFAVAILLFLAGVGLIVWGVVQAILFYVCREWFDRNLAEQVAQIGRDEIEKLIGQVRSNFVRKHILERLKTYGGNKAADFVRGIIVRYGRIGLLVAAIGFVAVIASFNVSTLLDWAWPAAEAAKVQPR
ncbi:MAG: hypothetical protein AB7F96_12815 [Beijerinckiaceae bacterium]